MKKPLNNVGVSEFQIEFFELTSTEQQFLIAQIRTDFTLFISSHFDLHVNQMAQINNMPTSFKTMLADGIAATWEAQWSVNFIKDTVAEDDAPDVKDIIVSSAPNMDPTGTNSSNIAFPFTIWIRYRTITP